MTRGARAGALAFAVVSAVLTAASACGGREPVYRWRDGAAATFEARVREELLPHRLAREVQIGLRGRVEAGSALALEIVRVHHERARDGRPWGAVVDTETAGASAADRDADDAAAARVAEALLGRRVVVRFDPADGLRSVAGLSDALAAAATPADPAAAEMRDGLVALVADDALQRSLRAAGLTAPPDDFRDRAAVLERNVAVFLPGRGLAPCRLLGTAGFDDDGSPVVRHEGRVSADAAPFGDPGPPPPAEVGAVDVAGVRVEAETQYDLTSHVPLRGRSVVRVPFTRGAAIVTTASFVLTVEP